MRDSVYEKHLFRLVASNRHTAFELGTRESEWYSRTELLGQGSIRSLLGDVAAGMDVARCKFKKAPHQIRDGFLSNVPLTDIQSKKRLSFALADFIDINRRAWRLYRLFEISKPYELATPEMLSAPFRLVGAADWYRFNTEHPEPVGWIEVFAVGFNEDKTITVVYVGHHCAGLCGAGGFSVLQKVEGKWKPFPWSGETCAWAS